MVWKHEIEDETLPQQVYLRLLLEEPVDKCKTAAVGEYLMPLISSSHVEAKVW